jgi:hypothetical protein
MTASIRDERRAPQASSARDTSAAIAHVYELCTAHHDDGRCTAMIGRADSVETTLRAVVTAQGG